MFIISVHASIPRDMFRQAKMTLAPRLARSRAVSNPMPEVNLELYLDVNIGGINKDLDLDIFCGIGRNAGIRSCVGISKIA